MNPLNLLPRPGKRADLKDKVVVITGAGGGMGREMAVIAAQGGALVAISDWNPDALEGTIELVKAAGAEVQAEVVDVSDRAAMAAWAEAVVAQFGRVNVVVNNAGVTMTGDFLDMTYEEFDWIVGINLNGVINGTKEFLPHLIASGDGHLINISSLFGLISIPGQSAYNATKYAVRGFTEAIREEMLVAGHPVTVTCVHPGGIKTGIARNGRKTAHLDAAALDELFDKIATMKPEKAAQIILDAGLAGQPRCLVGLDAHALHWGAKLAGARYQDVVSRVVSRRLPQSH